MKRAEIAGDKMAGLPGAILLVHLPETNIGLSILVEKLFPVNGTPRENFTHKYLESNNKKLLMKAIELLKTKTK
jgi:carboxyl-terminal processing protease